MVSTIKFLLTSSLHYLESQRHQDFPGHSNLLHLIKRGTQVSLQHVLGLPQGLIAVWHAQNTSVGRHPGGDRNRCPATSTDLSPCWISSGFKLLRGNWAPHFGPQGVPRNRGNAFQPLEFTVSFLWSIPKAIEYRWGWEHGATHRALLIYDYLIFQTDRQTDTATTSLQTLQNLPVDLALQPPLFMNKILKYLNFSTSGRFFYQPREGKPHYLHQMSRSV